MPNGTITKKQGEAAVASNTAMKKKASAREENMRLIGGFAGARVATRVLTTMVPSLAGMAPMAEIGGGLYLIWRGIMKDDGLKLGLGLGLGVGMVDRIGDFAVQAAGKFKGGNK